MGKPGAAIARLPGSSRRTALAQQIASGHRWPGTNDLVFCQLDGRPWLPDHVSKRFKRLATETGAPVVKLNEGDRHTGNSLMYDAEIRPDLRDAPGRPR